MEIPHLVDSTLCFLLVLLALGWNAIVQSGFFRDTDNYLRVAVSFSETFQGTGDFCFGQLF